MGPKRRWLLNHSTQFRVAVSTADAFGHDRWRHMTSNSPGMILTTKADDVWIVEVEEVADDLVGAKVIVEGVVAGMDRLCADWIGADSQPS